MEKNFNEKIRKKKEMKIREANFFGYIPYTKIYIFAFLLLAIGLSTGRFLMSLSSIIIASAWVLEGDYKAKWERAKTYYYTPIILTVVLLIHVIWLLNSENMDYAMRDIVKKLPLLSFPVVLGTISPFSRKSYLLIIGVFIAGVFVSTLISYGVYLDVFPTKKEVLDIRGISIFISHIRLSLLICLAIVLSYYYFFRQGKYVKVVIVLLSLWFSYFLILLSGTGIVILSLLILYSLIWVVKKHSSTIVKRIAVLTGLVFVMLSSFYLYHSYNNYKEIKDTAKFEALDIKTTNGEFYIHDTNSRVTENGYYLWLYIAPFETKKAWEERSQVTFDSIDKLGQPISATLYRYITSKGLRKDREGVLKLSENEITEIENGLTSVVQYSMLNKRLREIFFEFENRENGFSANGHSITQRLNFSYVGLQILKENWVLGVGTGDVPDMFNKKYDELHSDLTKNNRKRAHNQFLTFLIAFGVFGFAIWLFSFLYPMLKLKKDTFIYGAFLVILIVSFLGDDTLETQAGVTFFAFFNPLFLFHSKGKII